MNRRTMVKGLLVFAGGIAILPWMIEGKKEVYVEYRNFKLSSQQQQAAASLVDVIIPQTDTPGAKELGVHLWMMKMLDDCYDQSARDVFFSGLSEIGKKTDISAHLLQLEVTEMDIPAEAPAFYRIAKKLTIKGYLTSEYVMTKQLVYELVPGRWHGKVSVNI